MRKILTSMGLAALTANMASAQQTEGQSPFPRIFVTGSATVRTPPDTATLTFSVRGEGTGADEATRALVAKRKAIDAGVASIAGAVPIRAGSMSVVEARDRDCQTEWQARGQLSVGSCAVKGYVAEMELTVRLGAVAEAGTLTGLIARLGGSNVQLSGFSLSDDAAARRDATTKAIADGRGKAEAIAAGAGVHLGPLISVSDGQARFQPEIMVTAARAVSAPPPPPPPPPIAVSLTPQPIETSAQLQLVYAIER